MADQQVIKEFLVQLGFKTDEKSLKNFTENVAGATKNVVKLVGAIQGAALTIGAGVTAFANNLEKIYFSAKRAGSSAVFLKAIENSFQNINGSGEAALSSVQALAAFIRSQPGSVGYLKALGVDAMDASGNMRDMADIMVDVGKAMRNKPFSLAKIQAEQLGISEEVLRAMLDGSFDAELEKQKRALEKSGFNKAADDGHKFMIMIRDLKTMMQIFAVDIYNALVGRIGVSIESLSDWARTNGPQIANRIADILLIIIKLAEVIIPMITWIVDKFLALDKATDGWSTKILALVVALNMLGAAGLISNILSMAGAMTKLAMPILALAAAAAAGYGVGTLINKLLPDEAKDKIGEWTAKTLAFFGNDKAQAAVDAMEGRTTAAPKPKPKARPSSKGSEQKRLAELEKQYGLPAGILDNVWAAESGRGKNMLSPAGAEGHFQFMPATAKEYGLANPYDFDQSSDAAARYYRDLMKRYGNDPRKAAAAYNWGMGNVDKKGMENMPAETRGYVAKVTDGIQMSQSTVINVNGGDAMATGRAVASEQARVNQDMTRNLQTALN